MLGRQSNEHMKQRYKMDKMMIHMLDLKIFSAFLNLIYRSGNNETTWPLEEVDLGLPKTGTFNKFCYSLLKEIALENDDLALTE